MARMRILKPVLLVHGIASRGEWQDRFVDDLKGFFEPVQVKYGHFRGPLGPVLVVCELWILSLAFVLGLGLWAVGVSGWNALAIASIVTLLAFIPVTVDFRRRAALKAYHHAAGQVLHRHPHVIAHSFGTYLTVKLLEVVNGTRLSRIVLCGCVLPREYDWLAQIRDGRVAAVRNDYTVSDWVGYAAKLAGRLHSDLGHAGTHGMANSISGVHRLNKPELRCSSCAVHTGFVHDVDCSHLGHSDSLLVESHLREWWIPFLWGLDPAEHSKLLSFCETWIKAKTGHDWAKVAGMETQVRTDTWLWCHRQTLGEHLRRALVDHGLPSDPTAVIVVFDKLAELMHRARHAPLGSREAVFLEPDFAVNAAILSSR